MIRYYCDKCHTELNKECPLIVSFHMPDKKGGEIDFFGRPEHAQKDFYFCPSCFVMAWNLMRPTPNKNQKVTV